jgi:membrane fusion protein, macrolide-specific efflux system
MNDSSTSSRNPWRSGPSRPFAIGAIVLVATTAAWYGIHKYRARAAAEGEYIFATVQRGDIEDLVTATGALQPRDYVDVGAQVSGQVRKIHVIVGDEVKEGALLAEIDAEQSAARVEANRAQYRANESTMVERRNNLAKAERDYLRQQNLLKDDATTAEQVQNAETTLSSARSAINTLQAQMDQQRASMRVEEANLKYTRILAPMSGTVVSINAKQGQTLNTNQQAPTILRIADLSTMNVQTQVSEADVSKLSKGMRAYFTTLGSTSRRWYGTLSRIEPTPTVQNNVVLYNALFDVKNEGAQLLPSMTAQVFFVRADARNVLVVPMAALQQGQQLAGAATRGPGAAAASTAADAPAGAASNRQGTQEAAAADGPRPDGPPGGGGFGGGRPGGGSFGGFNNGQPPTPEQIEQFRRMREQRMAERQGAQGDPGPGAVRPRQGTVMVKQADGKLASRAVVIGVTNRVHGEVLSGLKEAEEVVAGRREPEAAAAQAGNQGNLGGFQGGGFPGGGFPGGGFPGGGGGGNRQGGGGTR